MLWAFPTTDRASASQHRSKRPYPTSKLKELQISFASEAERHYMRTCSMRMWFCDLIRILDLTTYKKVRYRLRSKGGN
jgi:hypothetical protein